jgi:hypothetical protein
MGEKGSTYAITDEFTVFWVTVTSLMNKKTKHGERDDSLEFAYIHNISM